MALCLKKDIPVRAHPFEGIWLDIGRPEDYADAAKLFELNRERLLPQGKTRQPQGQGFDPASYTAAVV
jgi:NDP-sugar pyrophosphorylase family protein